MVRNCQLSDLIYLTASQKVCVCECARQFPSPPLPSFSSFSSARQKMFLTVWRRLLWNKRRGTWSGQDEPFNEPGASVNRVTYTVRCSDRSNSLGAGEPQVSLCPAQTSCMIVTDPPFRKS